MRKYVDLDAQPSTNLLDRKSRLKETSAFVYLQLKSSTLISSPEVQKARDATAKAMAQMQGVMRYMGLDPEKKEDQAIYRKLLETAGGREEILKFLNRMLADSGDANAQIFIFEDSGGGNANAWGALASKLLGGDKSKKKDGK